MSIEYKTRVEIVEGVMSYAYKVRDGILLGWKPIKNLCKEHKLFNDRFECTYTEFEQAVKLLIEDEKK